MSYLLETLIRIRKTKIDDVERLCKTFLFSFIKNYNGEQKDAILLIIKEINKKRKEYWESVFDVIIKKYSKHITLKFLDDFSQFLKEKTWKHISLNYNLSEEFIERHKQNLFSDYILMNKKIKISEEFLIRNADWFTWKKISRHYNKMNKKFIEKYRDFLHLEELRNRGFEIK